MHKVVFEVILRECSLKMGKKGKKKTADLTDSGINFTQYIHDLIPDLPLISKRYPKIEWEAGQGLQLAHKFSAHFCPSLHSFCLYN